MIFWHQFELCIIETLQSLVCATSAMLLVSDWAIDFAAIVSLLVFFCVGRRAGMRLISVYFIASGMSYLSKMTFQPRPFWISYTVQELGPSAGFGLPSGHILILASVLFTAVQQRRPSFFAYLVVVMPVLLLGITRIYLGVHFIIDVVLGVLSAISIAAGATALPSWFANRVIRRRFDQSGLEIISLFLLIHCSVVLYFWCPDAGRWGYFAIVYRFDWPTMIPSLCGLAATLGIVEARKFQVWAFCRSSSDPAGSLSGVSDRYSQLIFCLAGIYLIRDSVNAIDPASLGFDVRLLSSVLFVVWATLMVPCFFARIMRSLRLRPAVSDVRANGVSP